MMNVRGENPKSKTNITLFITTVVNILITVKNAIIIATNIAPCACTNPLSIMKQRFTSANIVRKRFQ